MHALTYGASFVKGGSLSEDGGDAQLSVTEAVPTSVGTLNNTTEKDGAPGLSRSEEYVVMAQDAPQHLFPPLMLPCGGYHPYF